MEYVLWNNHSSVPVSSHKTLEDLKSYLRAIVPCVKAIERDATKLGIPHTPTKYRIERDYHSA